MIAAITHLVQLKAVRRDAGLCGFVLLAGILGATRSFGQIDPPPSPPTLEWERAYERRVGISVEQTRDGGYVLLDQTQKLRDTYLVRTDEEGNVLREELIFTDGSVRPEQVREMSDGGFLVVGTKTLNPPGEVYFARYGQEGDLVREKTEGFGEGLAIETATDGGCVIAGIQRDTVGAFLIKVDGDGRDVWELRPAHPFFYAAYAVKGTSDGGYVATGELSPDGQDRDVYLFKADASGELLWEKTFLGVEHEGGLSVEEGRDGSLVVGGWKGTRSYILKTSSSGDRIWDKTFTGSEIIDVMTMSDGGYVEAEKSALRRIDSDGNEIWHSLLRDRLEEVRPTSDGGFVLVGSTSRFGDPMDVYVAKLTPEGVVGNPPPDDRLGGGPEVEWETTFGGVPYEAARSVDRTSSDGFIVLVESLLDGWTTLLVNIDEDGNRVWQQAFDMGVAGSVQQTRDGGYILTGGEFVEPDSVLYLVKTDADGNPVWNRVFVGGGNNVRQTTDDGYILALSRIVDHGAAPPTSDSVLIKTGPDGEDEWETVFDFAWQESATSARETSDGGYIATGQVWDKATGRDLLLFKTDRNGSLLWQKSFGGEDLDSGLSLDETDDGYVVAGETRSIGEGGWDAYLLKTDPNGRLLWEQSFGGNSNDRAVQVEVTRDGGYILAGSTDSFGTGGRDLYIVRADSAGALLWERTLGGEGDDAGCCVQETVDGGYVVAGNLQTLDRDSDVYLVKLAPEEPSSSFLRRGDVDDNGKVEVTDAVRILGFLFGGGERPSCAQAADADDNGTVTLTDAVRILLFLFSGGPVIPAPGAEECGPDPTEDALDCAAYTSC